MEYNKNNQIDLHIHSNASDGTLSPSEIIDLAIKLNLGAISITDHDTIEGIKDVLSIELPNHLKFITGVEISTDPPENFSFKGSFHILGYGINIDNQELNEKLTLLKNARKDRNPQIIKKLNDLGVDITLEEIKKEEGIDAQIGRPHIAKLIIKKGYAKSINEVFDKYIGKGKPAYVDKFRIECSKVIELINNAGGIAVLAHPILLNIDKDTLAKLVSVMVNMGLKGIEVYYPDHSEDKMIDYKDIADKFGLLITGGTDFHGALKPDIKMAYGYGNMLIPYELYEKLTNALL
ncbi:MAG: PHP domain-containing protein [Desulfobacterales bacterium]|nr:PHP domain-containing protein [Desulfobacterales bacterium]